MPFSSIPAPAPTADQETLATPGPNAFQKLLLTGSQTTQLWSNQTLPNATNGEGSEENPLSFNVMPLPQIAPGSDTSPSPSGYILKNFTYYERLQFTGGSDDSRNVPIPAGAPNRGEGTLQIPFALFYDQRVRFAEGPGAGTTVHVENGAWLNLETGPPVTGPYPDFEVDQPNQQPANMTIAKQMSVPHGNSILALGSFSGPTTGTPTIPENASVLPTPTGLDTSKYTTATTGTNDDDYENPDPAATQDPTIPLRTALGLIKPTHYYTWSVSAGADGDGGHVTNIPFETTASNVTSYLADYWLMSADGGTTYNYLAYVQTINMTFTIDGTQYNFPHVTANVLTRGGGWAVPPAAGSGSNSAAAAFVPRDTP